MFPTAVRTLSELYPGEAGWGDVLFVAIWAFGTLLLAAYYVYRAIVSR